MIPGLAVPPELYALVGGLLLVGGLVWALVRTSGSRARADTERDAAVEANKRQDEARAAHDEAERKGRRRWL
jgi:hypothetical protein